MQVHRNEITTGILVLATFAGFIAVLVLVGMPGLIEPMNTYRIYFDNAGGIRQGAPVLLAGREIGKVTAMTSPVPLEKRPVGHPDYEVSIDVEVARDSEIYKNVTVRLTQQGIMGVEVIDFIQGDVNSGRAENHTEFVGERVPEISEAITDDLKRLTGPGSDLALTLRNVKELTEPDGNLALTLQNVQYLTERDSDMALTLKGTKTFMETLNHSQISQVVTNAAQLTDTLKREPWRLLWPSTKSYPEDSNAPSEKKTKVKRH
jgi:phospholipid/cholesterol/gamma-HCH transport system substrate-binding protein